MPRNPVGWFEIYVDDMARARTFYETVLAVKLEQLGAPGGYDDLQMFAFPMDSGSPGAAGTLAKMQGIQPGGNSVLVYFSCADCAVEAGRVAEAGGRVHRPKESIGEHGFIALAFDTEGNMFGLHSMS